MLWPWTASFALTGALLVLLSLPARADCEAGFEAFESPDYERAFRHLLPCAEAGDPIAQFNLGVMYEHGWGATPDDGEAVRWYRQAAEQGHAAAQNSLGVMYLAGRGVGQDDTEAARLFRLAAIQGLAAAQYNLGMMYLAGRGVAQDDSEAVRLLRRAGEQGHARSQEDLGIMFAQGWGGAQDDAEAARWYRRAADQGVAEAQFALGVAHALGRGVTQDDAEAARWYRRAAEQGHVRAQFNLGASYATGRGVAQDDADAARWLRAAADQGDAEAALGLGLSYATGIGVPQNDVEAVYWYRVAADQGLAEAQHHLGARYASGLGVPEDDLLAYIWLNLAAARLPQGEERARTVALRDKVAVRLSPAERARAQELAKDWQPKVAATSEGESSDRWWEQDLPESDKHAGAPPQRRLEGTGTGFAVSQDGHLLTNHHVVADYIEVRVQPPRGEAAEDWSDLLDFEGVNPAGGEAAAAVIVARDPTNDLALLRAPVRLPAAAYLDDRGIRAGDSVVAVGFPLPGLLASEASVTTGTVSALAGIGNDARLLQMTVPVQPGNSGGPLLDLRGRVVGVVVGKLDALQVASLTGDIPQNVNFAIKAGVARSFLAASGLVYESDENTRGDEGAYEPASSMELSPATVGAQAKAFTVLLECWK